MSFNNRPRAMREVSSCDYARTLSDVDLASGVGTPL
jgi:hypothetical protein